jgi:hypothetical protein
MEDLRYQWEPGGGLFAVQDGDRRERLSGDEAAFEEAVARMLADAEAHRLPKPRPARMLAAMATALAADLPAAGFERARADVLRWVDGPGLDVILDVCLRPARAPGGARSAARRGR